MYKLQHGFQQRRNSTTQLVYFYHIVLQALDKHREVNSVHLDFSKAFDSVSHSLLIRKLEDFRFHGPLLSWFKSYLSGRKQRLVFECQKSEWLPVTSGVPQGSILGPVLFTIFVNDTPNQLTNSSEIALYADDSKMARVISSQDDEVHLQCDLIN